MRINKLKELLDRYLSGKATPEEAATIEKWYAEADKTPIRQAADVSAVKENIYQKINAELNDTHKTIPLYKKEWFVRVAAACILLIAGISSWYVQNTKQISRKAIVTSAPKPVPGDDVPSPSSVYAELVLADGRKIRLDSARNGSIATQRSAEIVKRAEGWIAYTPAASINAATEFNTLTVPRGSRIISLEMADGTIAVLNAASSITYPTAFTGNSRKVTITGEVYFEVAKNESKPFYVEHEDVSIKVLGTHFNVNSYADEKTIAVTLLEGAVSVTHGSTVKTIVPGQQANTNQQGGIVVDGDVDMEEVMAWKNGRFQFGEKAGLRSIMRQLSRWYDVDVEYRGEADPQFWGSMTRSVNVSEVLEMLEETGRVKFKIEGKKIFVMPVKP